MHVISTQISIRYLYLVASVTIGHILTPLGLFANDASVLPDKPAMPDAYTATMEDILTYEQAMKNWYASIPTETRMKLFDESRSAQLSTSDSTLITEHHQWEKIAVGQRLVGTDVRELERDGLLIKRDQIFLQSFQAYTDPTTTPFFITSDSLLNGYHVLLEASLQRASLVEAKLLRSFLNDIFALLSQSSAESEYSLENTPEIIEHGQRVLGPALVLLGEKPVFLNKNVADDVDEAVRRIRAADSLWLPPWLGPAESDYAAVDFTQMKPKGFYSKNPKLIAYFQSLQWLRAIPFRIDRPTEFITFGCFADIVSGWHINDQLKIINLLSSLFGGSSNLDIYNTSFIFMNFRKYLFKDTKSDPFHLIFYHLASKGNFAVEKINGNWGVIPRNRAKNEIYNIFLFSPRLLIDDVLFKEVSNLEDNFSVGLAVASFLGSEWAVDTLKSKAHNRSIQHIGNLSKLWERHYISKLPYFPESNNELDNYFAEREVFPYKIIDSLYSDYLFTLKGLFLEADPAAPEWANSQKWHQKSTETALSGWAQMRHSLSLIATQRAYYRGLVESPLGFVEPNPEFFSRMTLLIKRTEDILARCGVFDTPPIDLLFELNAALNFAEQNLDANGLLSDSFKQSEKKWLEHSLNLLELIEIGINPDPHSWDRDDWKDIIDSLKYRLAKVEADLNSPNPSIINDTLENRWKKLFQLSSKLESLAHKQLRGLDWSAADAHFIREYGESLAYVMLYDGNSWLNPTDDAPRIAGISSNPITRQTQQIAIGRPVAIYVLYPWKGTRILCRGAILPYHEFESPTVLNDTEWKEMEPNHPQPEWLNN